MPVNCPCSFDVCDNICRFFNEGNDTCSYFKFSPPIPLSEILTASERLDRLEIKETVSNSADLEGLKSSVRKLWNNFNTYIKEHPDKKKTYYKNYDI